MDEETEKALLVNCKLKFAWDLSFSLTECPVCLEAVEPQTQCIMFHCGHRFCSPCARKLVDQCALCRAPIGASDHRITLHLVAEDKDEFWLRSSAVPLFTLVTSFWNERFGFVNAGRNDIKSLATYPERRILSLGEIHKPATDFASQEFYFAPPHPVCPKGVTHADFINLLPDIVSVIRQTCRTLTASEATKWIQQRWRIPSDVVSVPLSIALFFQSTVVLCHEKKKQEQPIQDEKQLLSQKWPCSYDLQHFPWSQIVAKIASTSLGVRTAARFVSLSIPAAPLSFHLRMHLMDVRVSMCISAEAHKAIIQLAANNMAEVEKGDAIMKRLLQHVFENEEKHTPTYRSMLAANKNKRDLYPTIFAKMDPQCKVIGSHGEYVENKKSNFQADVMLLLQRGWCTNDMCGLMWKVVRLRPRAETSSPKFEDE